MFEYLMSHWTDILGMLGVVLILWSYLFVQIGSMSVDQFVYSIVNLVGSIMILVSLLYHFNLASFIIEIAWTLISVYGIYRCAKLRRQHE